jgi:histidyl-tRNA synthetase
MSSDVKGLVTPQTPKGFQDYLPEQMAVREGIVGKIKDVYRRYGFVEIDTPILEYLVTLIGTGGDETNKQMFRLESPEREAVAMRFDLTVPFARVLAQYRDKIKLPFRRYHMGPVFRADKPGVGRFRQFVQFDIDVAGSSSVAIDAEMISAMCDVMRAVGLINDGSGSHEFQVKINNRKLLDAMLFGFGIEDVERHKQVLRVIDKLQKVGVDNVRKELGEGRIDESGDPIKGVGLDAATINGVLNFVSVTGDTRLAVVDALENVLPKTAKSADAIAEMRELASYLESLGVGELDAAFDPSLARGLDYYTGPVYEAVLPGAPECGSVMGGGRYDGLVQRFLDAQIPAAGASIGIDRFVEALIRVGKLDAEVVLTKVMVISTPGVPHTELLSAATELRNMGISADVYISEEKCALRDKLALANARLIPVAVILGESELAQGLVNVKDLRSGLEQRKDLQDREEFRKAGKAGQVTVERKNLAPAVQEILAKYGL